MIQIAVAVALAWLLLRDQEPSDDEGSGSGGSTWVDPNVDENGDCIEGYKRNSENVCVPFIPDVELDPLASWSIEYSVEGYDENVVWQLDVQDHQMPDGTFFVIGNLNHTGFLRASTSRGTLTIPETVAGNGGGGNNVIVYPDLAAASAKLDLMANPPEDDGTGAQPQPQPDDEEEDDSGAGDGFGGLPPQQGYQLGQNGGTYTM